MSFIDQLEAIKNLDPEVRAGIEREADKNHEQVFHLLDGDKEAAQEALMIGAAALDLVFTIGSGIHLGKRYGEHKASKIMAAAFVTALGALDARIKYRELLALNKATPKKNQG